jgi:vacuolar-type H+-ATPase subunit I/STV1
MEMKSESLNVSRPPRLRRGLFGIRTRDVHALLDEREEELGRIRDRADSSGDETNSLRDQISSLEAKLEQAQQELAAFRELGFSPVDGAGAAKFCDCPPSDSLLEEMTKVVGITEDATQRILQHARETLMKEIEAAQDLREQAKSEIIEAAAWRRHWAPILKAFQTTVMKTASAIEDVPERVRDALAPLTAAAAALDEDLRQFSAFEVTMSAGTPDGPVVVDEAEDIAESDGKPVVITDEAEPDHAPMSS